MSASSDTLEGMEVSAETLAGVPDENLHISGSIRRAVDPG
jgi:hypothetical protein